ncbi:MAG TPA: Hsp70 family protein, partial [Kofleriaceae bacterium]
MSDPIVGIDLGTSNTVVAHASASGEVTVFADDAGARIHPSVVSFHPSGGVVVGAAAKQRKVIDPQNTVYSIKRLIGRAYQSPEVQTARGRSPFQIKEGPSNAPVIVTRAGTFAVPEISAIVLDHARNIAAARLERTVDSAVVTVPASFNDAQRSATATAGAIAGLTVVRVLNEPTAAALAYGRSRNLREIIAVYDFGGGTFDITLLRLEDQVYEVLGTSGDTFLGGDDLDERLVEKMVARFLAENRIDLRTNEVAMMRLRAVSEQTKIELSRRPRAVVRIDEIAYGPRGAPLDLQIEITRDEFVREIADLVDRTFPVCREALALAGLAVDQISDVLLVGGTTKIPYVRDQVGKFFGKAPRTDINPEDAVAAGAALQATALERILSRRPSAKLDVHPRPAADEETTSGFTDILQLADPELSPDEPPGAAERTRRPTAGPTDAARRPATESTRPDTRYSVNRARVRDQVGAAER